MYAFVYCGVFIHRKTAERRQNSYKLENCIKVDPMHT